MDPQVPYLGYHSPQSRLGSDEKVVVELYQHGAITFEQVLDFINDIFRTEKSEFWEKPC